MMGNRDDGFERPFEMEGAPELSRLSDVPKWKQADFSDNWSYWEEDLPFHSTDFDVTHVDPEDWW